MIAVCYVYRFLDKSKNVIYVGKSKQDLEQRFRGHSHLPEECYNLVYTIEYIECSTETDMSIKELYYINKYRNNDNYYFNVLDIADLPTSVSFNDEWKMYEGPLDTQFHNSINFIKGFTNKKKIRYNKDGSIDKRKTNKEKGTTSFVDGFTSDEVDLIISQLVKEINNASNNNQEQIRLRNLMMFVLGINTPLKPSDFLNLRYKDLFDENDNPKPIEMQLGRFYKDAIIQIPLRKIVIKVISAYTQKYGINYSKNAEEFLFVSRKHQVVSLASWNRILTDLSEASGINKSIGAETIRKTYGINVYEHTENKLNALLFLGELWGHTREAQIIKYLNLTEDAMDYDYYLGEAYSLGNVDLQQIHCLKSNKSVQKQKSKTLKTEEISCSTKTVKKKKPQKTNRIWTVEKKIEIIEKNLIQKISQKDLAKEYDVDAGAISRWISAYKQYGKIALEDKRFKT